MTGLRAAFGGAGRCGQRFQDFQPADPAALIGSLRPVRQVAVEGVTDSIFGQAQPGGEFRVGRQFRHGDGLQSLIHFARDAPGRTRIVDLRAAGRK